MLEQKVTVRVNEQEKRQLENLARMAHMDLSKYIRQLIFCGQPEVKTALPVNFMSGLCILMSELEKLRIENPEVDTREIERMAHDLWGF